MSSKRSAEVDRQVGPSGLKSDDPQPSADFNQNGINQRLENMNADLDRNERHLRGIESIPGALLNKATKDKTKRKDLVFESRDQKIAAVKKRDIEVEVLFKVRDLCCFTVS